MPRMRSPAPVKNSRSVSGGMGVIVTHKSKTIAVTGTTACKDSLIFSRSFRFIRPHLSIYDVYFHNSRPNCTNCILSSYYTRCASVNEFLDTIDSCSLRRYFKIYTNWILRNSDQSGIEILSRAISEGPNKKGTCLIQSLLSYII